MNEEMINKRLQKEFPRMLKEIEQKMEAHDDLIREFQFLIRNEGPFSPIVDKLPYPVAFFKRNDVLCMANQVLQKKSGIHSDDIAAEKINLLNRITNDNYSIFKAVEDVFFGEISMHRQLTYALEIFCKDDSHIVSDTYHSALLFPVRDKEGNIPFGVILLMK